MSKPNTIDFFIGSNSAKGSCSYFDSFYDRDKTDRVWLLKGGAGSGKSTLMKRLAAECDARGIPCERVHCPSDPGSLDGVLAPRAGAAMADATAPHALEAKLHAVLERYISLTPYIDCDAVRSRRGEVAELSETVSALRARAIRRAAAAEAAQSEIFNMAAGGADIPRLKSRGEALARRYIPKRGEAGGFLKKRFLSGITPDGLVAYAHTPEALAACFGASPRFVLVHDPFGFSPFLLAPVAEAAAASGFETFACYCPLTPEKLEHVLVPELGLCFLSVSAHMPFSAPEGAETRNIRLNAAVSPEVLKKHRLRIKTLSKAVAVLLDDAVENLAAARLAHDRLEAVFKPHTDFSGLDALAERIKTEFFA